MPASKHNRKANTPKRASMFNKVRQSMEKRGAPVGRAIAAANSVVNRDYAKSRKKGKRTAQR